VTAHSNVFLPAKKKGHNRQMTNFDNASHVMVNQVELAVVEAGAGEPLVLVHGSVSDLRTWSRQIDKFAEHHRTIAYSRRYPRPNRPIPRDEADRIQLHVDDLAELIELLEARPAHVVGHSWGGLIALILAIQRPEIFRSLVLVEPAVVPMHITIPPKIGQIIGLFLRSPKLALAIVKLGGRVFMPAQKAFEQGDDKAAIEHFGRGVLGDHAFESLSSERYEQVWENRGPDRAQALHRGMPDLTGAEYSKVTCPVLLVAGAESPAIFSRLIDDLVKRFPHAKTCVVNNASHIVHEDAPAEFNSEVLKFLSSAR